MADNNSSLPVRTQSNGDLAVKIVDGTTPSQALAVDSSGRIISKTADTSGVGITSTLVSTKQALDVNVANSITASNPSVGTTGTTAPTSATEVGAVVSTAAPTYTTGNLNSLSLTTAGSLRVDGSGSTQPVSGTVTANAGTGNFTVVQATGSNLHAVIDSGSITVANAAGASAVNIQDGGNSITVDGTVAISNLPATADTNYGTAGSSTLRTASQIGNATGAANFNSGSTGAQTLRVEANQGAANATPWNQNISQVAGATPSATNALAVQITNGTAYLSASNPLPVALIDPPAGTTQINDYKTVSAVAAAATDNHDYTVTALKTLHLEQVIASGSGQAKMEIQVESGVASGTFNTRFVKFTSTAEKNMEITLASPILVAAGVRVRVIMTNRDLLAQDLYSTICGYEA